MLRLRQVLTWGRPNNRVTSRQLTRPALSRSSPRVVLVLDIPLRHMDGDLPDLASMIDYEP